VEPEPKPEPEPEPEPTPEPKHTIPPEHTVESLRRLYGRATNPVTGHEEGFDLKYAPSQVWLSYGKKSGQWPALKQIIRRGNGDQLYQWEGGLTWTRKA